MSSLARCVAVASLLFVLTTASRAEELCYGATFPMQTTNWNDNATVPTFNPALGTLTGVRVRLTSTIQGAPSVENSSNASDFVTTVFCADVTVARPDTTLVTTTVPVAQYFDSLSAFDGTLDFGGTSGIQHLNTVAQNTSTIVLNSAPDLTLFTGPLGGFSTVTLPVEARNTAFVIGAGPIVSALPQQASIALEVCYVYTPFVATYCTGDGSGTACPCGNASPTSAAGGCTNATGTSARLASSGYPSLAADNLALVATNLPAGSVALVFQGTARDNAGAGSVFGDGLRCVSGTVIRLAVKNAGAGVVVYPQVGEPSVSVKGLVPANAVRHYQVWYRDSAAFCSSSTFNLTQALTVNWQS